MEKHVLSKSRFIRGVQCLKSLYLDKKRPFLRDKLPAEQRLKFKRGSDVGILAQQLFPDGVNLKPVSPSQYRKAVLRTKETIENGANKVIYEAAFQFDGVLILLDILVLDDEGWKAYEVKSSKSISKTYLFDAALQYYVIRGSGLNIKDFSIIYINSEYIRKEELDLNALFNKESVLEDILPLQGFVQEQIEKEKETLQLQHSPKIDIGEHCLIPYPCDFQKHCWKHIPSYSVFDLDYIDPKNIFDLYAKKIISPAEIKDISVLNKNQQEVLKSHLQGRDYLNCVALSEKFKKVNDNYACLKILTTKPAVPVFSNNKPYQATPVGIAYKRKNMNKPEAQIFNPGKNGFTELAVFLNNKLKDSGTLICYNQPEIESIFEHILKYYHGISSYNVFDLSETIKEMIYVPFKGISDNEPKSLNMQLKLKQNLISHAEASLLYQDLMSSVSGTKNDVRMNKLIDLMKNVVIITEKYFEIFHKKCNIV